MQLISASVPKRNAPSGVQDGQNELVFTDAKEGIAAQFSAFPGGKIALVSDGGSLPLFREYALSPRALSLVSEGDALPLFSLPEGVRCVIAAGGRETLLMARCFAAVRRIPCVLVPSEASLAGASEARAGVLVGGERAMHRLAPARILCDRTRLLPTLGEAYARLLTARLSSFEGRALAAFGMGEERPAFALPEAAFEPVVRASLALPAPMQEGEGFVLAARLCADGEEQPFWRAYLQLTALYAAFFRFGRPRRSFVPDYSLRASRSGSDLPAEVPSPGQYALRAMALERIRGRFAEEAAALAEERPAEAEKVSSLSPRPVSLRGGSTFRLRYLPEYAPGGLACVLRDFGLMEW